MVGKSTFLVVIFVICGAFYFIRMQNTNAVNSRLRNERAKLILEKTEKRIVEICGQPKKIERIKSNSKLVTMYPDLVGKRLFRFSNPEVEAIMMDNRCVISRTKHLNKSIGYTNFVSEYYSFHRIRELKKVKVESN